MKIAFHKTFYRSLNAFPDSIKKKFKKQARYLLDDIRHPSLRAKKYDESKGIWQARIDDNIRFYFVIKRDTYILINIKNHPK